MKSFRLEYRFEKGWKFALVVPPREKLEIPGRPAHFSVWVEGDASGNTLRSRFRDSSGETFQSSAGEVNWKGWRRVELPLDGAGANHWGGNDDGRIDYPIRWDSVFVLDSSRDGGAGSIRFAGAALVYPES
jgi:hypothetical protein